MCDEKPFYSFEIYKNGELEIVLRSDDPKIITEGSVVYSDLFCNDSSSIKSDIDFQLINYGKNCPLNDTVNVSGQRCKSCYKYGGHNDSDKYVKCSGGNDE